MPIPTPVRRGDISLEVVNIFVGQLAFEFGAEVFEVGHGVLHELLDRHVRDFPERNHNCGNIKQSVTCSLTHSPTHSLPQFVYAPQSGLVLNMLMRNRSRKQPWQEGGDSVLLVRGTNTIQQYDCTFSRTRHAALNARDQRAHDVFARVADLEVGLAIDIACLHVTGAWGK